MRFALVVGGGLVLAGFFVASIVQPDPRGFGTHQQFGLPPCSFREILGIPCPSCGGTTSVAYFVRGEWIKSAKANTAVFALAVLGLLYLPWCVVSLFQGRLWGVSTPTHLYLTITITLSAVAIVQWMWRLM